MNILEATSTLIGEYLSGDIHLVVIGYNTVLMIILLVSPSERTHNLIDNIKLPPFMPL